MASSARTSHHKIHEPSFMAACMKIDQAVQRGLLNSQAQTKYTKVGVLMMHWDNDDMGVKPLEKDLANLFSKLYNFKVETFVIPSCPQTGTLMGIMNRRLQQFVEMYEGPRSLLIYVYSGHAHAGPPPLYDRCIWLGTTAVPRSRCPQLDWAFQRVIPDGAVGDTLYILACHYYATASSAINRSDNEYLVAASMGDNQVGLEVAAQYNKSFTQHLIDLLEHNAGAPQSVVSIHASLKASMKSTPNTSAVAAIPLHIGAKTKPSIVLSRLAGTPNDDVQVVKKSDTTGAGKILVSVTFQPHQTTGTDIQQFQAQLSLIIPLNLSSAKIEAVFQATGPYSIVLLTLPVEVWDCLEGTGAFTFIDHVDSHNLLLESRALPIIQKQVGYDENEPPQPSSLGKK
ncbi:MAG: hypothetical protein Q9188_005197 [Gyalolechia gomerana]